MRKRFVSYDELNRIIRLKHSGASWQKIQDQTGVPRRSAKQAYEDWHRSQAIEELKAARVVVATEELRKHVDQLIDITNSLAVGLRVPLKPEETLKAEEFVNSLWEQKYVEPKGSQEDKTKEERERRRFVRECQMLLKSLQDHTREKVHWKLLDQWKEAWNRCIVHLSGLEKYIKVVADEIVSKDTDGIIDSINKKRETDTAAQQMAQAVLNVIWQSIINGTLDPENPKIILSYKSINDSVDILIEKELFEGLDAILRPVAEEFCTNKKQIIIKPLIDDVLRMNETINKFEEMLNPLILRPLILRTRCELCPA